jgi:DNA invertase Pin-like site-specific DNA recombinase
MTSTLSPQNGIEQQQERGNSVGGDSRSDLRSIRPDFVICKTFVQRENQQTNECMFLLSKSFLLERLCMTPAAQYVRMSTEEQEYSIPNQKAAIAEFANKNGLTIVRTYEDPGETGLSLKHRLGLRQLLADVVSHTAPYKKVLVFDVSRWGRFQDPDEAAHYEFICKKAGIGVIYCAEHFDDRNALSGYFAKILKRTSAAEYSRELSIKSFENAKHTIELGFRAGGSAPFGYRRMLISSDGQPKQILQASEWKVLKADRVTLVRGPLDEVKCIKSIFQMCIRRKSFSGIASELNRKGILKRGRKWNRAMVENVLENRQYTGTYIWNKTTTRLGTPTILNPSSEWLVRVGAFPPIVSQCTFDKAKQRRQKQKRWTDSELLERVKRLYARKGYLSERLVQRTKGVSPTTLFYRLGPLSKIYAMVGYTPPADSFLRSNSRGHSQKLRAGLVRQLLALFPKDIHTFRLPRRHRLLLNVEGETVSILLCRSIKTQGKTPYWSLDPVPCESEYMTLLCRLNRANDGFFDFRLLPKLGRKTQGVFTGQHALLKVGEQIHGLEDLCNVVKRVQKRQDCRINISLRGRFS